jgi:hypothetical protein
MKVCKKVAILFIFLLTTLTAFGQDCVDGGGLPGDDPDAHPIGESGCPLDTWIIVLAGAALFFTVLHLRSKQNPNTRNLLHESN